MFKAELFLYSVEWCQERKTILNIIQASADIFAQGNPRFDREKFYVASGLTKDGDLPS